MKIFIDPEGKGNISVPNIGLAYISANLNLRKEEHKIIDQLTQPRPKNRFLEYRGDLFGISVKMNTYREAQKITKIIREKYGSVKIIWGGPHILCSLERIKRENPYVEPFVGEWDYTEDLDSLPFPRYFNFDSYDSLYKLWSLGRSSNPIITSRGCPYS